MLPMLLQGAADTLVVTVLSTLVSYILGAPIGIILYGTSDGGLFPSKPVNSVLGVIVNVVRSIPFIILLIMTQPVAKAMVGTKLGNEAFIVYLVIAATPFVARMIESSLKEVDGGVIEAAQAMGSSNLQIILKVLIPEAKPSLLVGSAIAITTILGYTPMTYLVSGSGLGQLAIQYGLYRFNKPMMYMSSLFLIVLVQIMQEGISAVAKRTDKRIR
ncbi:MAG: ABC transporter permease [Clostridia bacterium]|nr:ABC transporter permease [Clostridia bacterium]